MPLIEAIFDQHKIDSLRRYLQREADKGRAKDYEIIIDGFKVVSRTSDIEEFDDYEQEIKDNTRNLTILVFDGPGTNRNTRYSFQLQHEAMTPRSNGGLGEIDQLVKDKLDAKDRQHKLDQLRQTLAATEQELKEAEEYSQQLEQRIQDIESGKEKRVVGIAEFAGYMLNGLLKQNPQLLTRLPGGEALAGLIGADAPPLPQSPPEASVSFQKSEPDEELRHQLGLINQMKAAFSPDQMAAVLILLDHYCRYPDKITETITFLNIEQQPL